MQNIIKILFSGIVCLSLVFSSWGEERSENSTTWSGSASVGIALVRGNADTTNLSLTLSAKGPLSRSIHNANRAFFLISKERDITNTESMGLESQLQWEHTARIFSYINITGLRDRFKNYSYRIFPVIGVGYKVIATPKIQLSLRSGISEVFTRYYDSGETDSFSGIALSDQFTWKISESAEITQTLNVEANISQLSRYFLRYEMSLASAITKGLSVNITLMDYYDNKPVGDGIKKNDISILAGLSAKF